MKQSENITELLSSLAEIQNELPTMPKSSQGYGYKYTALETITQTIKGILHKHNVGYLQSVGSENGLQTLTTRVFNTKGEWIEDTALLPIISSTKNNAAQTLGMSITYMRRYMLSAMLGITSDEDVDASSFEQNQKTSKQSGQSASQNNSASQKTKPQLKGGEATPEENAEIKKLLQAKYTNGTNVFSAEEIRLYGEYRKEKFTAKELIDFIKKALSNRYSGSQKPSEENNEIY